MVEVTFDPNVRFEKVLVRLMRSFNYLDTNVGLCISHLSHPTDPEKTYPALVRMTPEKRAPNRASGSRRRGSEEEGTSRTRRLAQKS